MFSDIYKSFSDFMIFLMNIPNWLSKIDFELFSMDLSFGVHYTSPATPGRGIKRAS